MTSLTNSTSFHFHPLFIHKHFDIKKRRRRKLNPQLNEVFVSLVFCTKVPSIAFNLTISTLSRTLFLFLARSLLRRYIFTIVSYLIGVFIFATIVGQVGNVITNRNANRLEFERLLDGAKTYMRHHKVPGGMKRRVLRWYDYSWSRGRIQGGGDINTALGLLPDKLKTELALHVNLSVLKKVRAVTTAGKGNT